jgi:hypothetical protein
MLDSWYNNTIKEKDSPVITQQSPTTNVNATLKKKRICTISNVSFSEEPPVVHHYEYVNEPIKRHNSIGKFINTKRISLS